MNSTDHLVIISSSNTGLKATAEKKNVFVTDKL